jgi:hypothetical protein
LANMHSRRPVTNVNGGMEFHKFDSLMRRQYASRARRRCEWRAQRGGEEQIKQKNCKAVLVCTLETTSRGVDRGPSPRRKVWHAAARRPHQRPAHAARTHIPNISRISTDTTPAATLQPFAYHKSRGTLVYLLGQSQSLSGSPPRCLVSSSTPPNNHRQRPQFCGNYRTCRAR